jgi:hypothetical protein
VRCYFFDQIESANDQSGSAPGTLTLDSVNRPDEDWRLPYYVVTAASYPTACARLLTVALNRPDG